jgi:hypothetical protein
METQAPGLRWRTTHRGKTPMWRASKAAIRAGYPVKTVNLAPFADNERLLAQRAGLKNLNRTISGVFA